MASDKLGSIYSENFKRWFGDWENSPETSSKVVDSNGLPLPVYHGTVRKAKDGLPFKIFNLENATGDGVMFSDKPSVASFFSGGGKARFANFEEKFEKWPHKDTMEGLVNFLNQEIADGTYELEHISDFWRINQNYDSGGSTSTPLGHNEEESYQKLLKYVQKEVEYLDGETKYGYNGGVYKVYLNIRNPYIYDAQGKNFFSLVTEFSKEKINVFTLVSYVRQTSNYDGVIVRNVRETTYGNGVLSTDYIVFKPNQIKHALDNSGNYSPDSDDITESTFRRYIRKIVRECINEVRYIDTRDSKYNGRVQKKHWTDVYNQEPIKNNDTIRVYHGCELKTACDIAINGTSGKVYHPRQYSYESGMNPLGIFVTTDFETAKKFGVSNSGMAIIEFTARASDLESPVWNGQDSYFGQGSNPMPFRDKDERNAQKMRYRQNALNTKDVEYYDYNKKQTQIFSNDYIRKSDKPEVADNIFNNPEHQALYMGDLNPNQIKRIWVRLPHEDGYVYSSDRYEPLSVREFLRQFGNKEWQDGYDHKGQPFYMKIQKNKLFNPNDDVHSFEELIDKIWQNKQDRGFFKTRDKVEKNLREFGLLQPNPPKYAFDTINHILWPKQIIQLYGKDYFQQNFDRLGQTN